MLKWFTLGIVLPCCLWADPIVLRTSDANEPAYSWTGASCVLGLSDLVVLTDAGAAGSGRLHFVFRNIRQTIADLGAEAMTLEVNQTRAMGMTFTDRENFVWAFQPSRNRARCTLNLKKNGATGLQLWGSCQRLSPRAPEETFITNVEIPETSPLHCQLTDAAP